MLATHVEAETQEWDAEHEGPGARLAAARKSAGIPLKAIGDALHFEPQLLTVLERDDYEDIPPVFVRGYLRQYARLLRLPEDEIVRLYDTRGAQAPSLVPAGAERRARRSRDRVTRMAAYVGVIAIAGLAFGWWQSNRIADPGGYDPAPSGASVESASSEPGSGDSTGTRAMRSESADPERRLTARDPDDEDSLVPAPTPRGGVRATVPQETLPQESGAQGTGLPSVPRPPAVTTIQSTDERLTSVSEVPEEASGSRVDRASAIVTDGEPASGSALPSATAGVRVPEEAGTGGALATVRFDFADDCWVEVTDASGRRLLFDLYAAGSSQVVEGVAPMTVVLGNAAAVTIEYNGRPFDHSRFRNRRGVAQFELGERGRQGSITIQEVG